MEDIYTIADKILLGFERHFGADWNGKFPRRTFDSICIITGVGRDQRTHERYWQTFVKVGWLKDKNGIAGEWNFDLYDSNKEFFYKLKNNGQGRSRK